MHRLAAMPGGWDPNTEGVVFIEQSPGDMVILTAADTDIQTLSAAIVQIPTEFPTVRVANLLNLQQQLTIDTYADDVLSNAKVILLRILGGRAYWSYGLEVVKEVVEQTRAALIVLPGDDRPDPDLMSHSTVPLATVNRVWRYWTEGGVDNIANALRYLAASCLELDDTPAPPIAVPRVGRYTPASIANLSSNFKADAPGAGILFYRAHYLSGNTEPIDALCNALNQRGLSPVPVFVSSLREIEVQAELQALWRSPNTPKIDILLNATSFSVARLDTESPQVDLWRSLDVPVLQVILSGGTEAQWQEQWRGLSPRDMAMNVALPEVDGRIITRAISFKTVEHRHKALETDVVTYQSVSDRVSFVADLAANWVTLRRTAIADRRIALILANYPTRDGRLANGVGLDTPASCIQILKALQKEGYTVTDIPATGDELIQRLTAGVTNDLEGVSHRPVHQSITTDAYQVYFETLPKAVQNEMRDRWGEPKTQPHQSDVFPVPGLQLGNIFIGIQPARGYDQDPTLNYHAPDLEPTHDYLAFYAWLRETFQTHAIIHVGKHGNLEWLPGKSVALSPNCYPEVAFGAIPHLYPFIVNDPGEGSQAKRRAHAVILDHLTPPLTRAELYQSLSQLEALIDEYYEAQSLDPSRLPVIRDRIFQLAVEEHLSQELGYGEKDNSPKEIDIAEFVTRADGYLCELKEAQIRDGLHIFGQCPTGRQLRDLIIAIARHPGSGRIGLTRAIAQDWGLSLDPLADDFGEMLSECDRRCLHLQHCRTVGEAVEVLEEVAAQHVDHLLQNPESCTSELPRTVHELKWISDRLFPNLQKTTQEIEYLLHGLSGGYVPSGASGAPTRGRAEVLPTGRNFFSVDIRAIPTESAWDVGRKAAEALVERYTQEQGEYPKTLGLSIWGTSTMRTGGDDIAEALALLGVRPVWDGVARRVVDIEVLPVELLGRPRVDVTLRVSGFFRDAFPNLIDLFDRAVAAVESLPEPEESNPLAAQVKKEILSWENAGLTQQQAKERSRYRIFGSKPGAYGAGLQGLIESQNWETDDDLARAYLNWSSYAYTGQGEGRSASEAFEARLRNLQIVLHNQDNREHDLLDSDDYYQFQGGLTAAVRSLTGKNPEVYFGDHSLPARPRVRRLQDEIARVYRSRVVNPKWISGVMRHGYKGAFEMAATVDYLFAYSATTQSVPGYMYEGVAQAYVLNDDIQAFVQNSNPWALRDMAERLLEAHQRGLWEQPKTETLEALRAIALEADAHIEGVMT